MIGIKYTHTGAIVVSQAEQMYLITKCYNSGREDDSVKYCERLKIIGHFVPVDGGW